MLNGIDENDGFKRKTIDIERKRNINCYKKHRLKDEIESKDGVSKIQIWQKG